MKVKNESEVAQSCPTLSDPMDCSPPGSSIHGVFQARVLEWGVIAFSKSVAIHPTSRNKKNREQPNFTPKATREGTITKIKLSRRQGIIKIN